VNDAGITFSSVREGEVIGEHTVRFELADEVIEITHKALERDVFAKGALKAGQWLVGQAPGYYSTADWLGLR
jgi:4-hydroxy-tetrahydrodipicolinate reductase